MVAACFQAPIIEVQPVAVGSQNPSEKAWDFLTPTENCTPWSKFNRRQHLDPTVGPKNLNSGLVDS